MFDELESDAGNARWFARVFGNDVRFVRARGGWIVKSGRIWRDDIDNEIERLAKKTIGSMMDGAGEHPREKRDRVAKHLLRSEQAPRIAAAISLLKSEHGITIQQSDLDSDPWLVGIGNNVLDLRTGELAAGKSFGYITRQLACEFNPHAKCPTWRTFLARFTDGDAELEQFLHRAVGYSLTGDTGEQCVFVAYGTGANGKSVFLRTVRNLFGAYGADAAADTFLDRRETAASNDLARLAGARFVVASEIDEGRRLAESVIKVATGGEALAVRFLFHEFFEFTPSFKLWLGVNHKPVIRGDDNGIWRRIRLIPCRVTIPADEQDKELLNTLRLERSGILNWAIEGCLAWQRDGLRSPDAVTAATDAYRAESDALGEWLRERVAQIPGISEQASKLYADYRQYTDETGGQPLSMRRWGQRMGDRGYSKHEGRIVRYIGLSLRDLRDLCSQFPQPSSYIHTRNELQEKGRKGRNGRSTTETDDETEAEREAIQHEPPTANDYRAASRGE